MDIIPEDCIEIQIPNNSLVARRITDLLDFGGYKNVEELTTVAINRLFYDFLAQEAGKPFPDE